MATAWRITKAKHVATALTGEGSFLVSGRWNSKGKRMVYASQSLSLAALETLIRLDNVGHLASYLYCRIDLPEEKVARLNLSLLPPYWKDDVNLTRSLGDGWLDQREALAIAVPSAVIDVEWNYLINPHHPDFSSRAQVRVSEFSPFTFDPRLRKPE
jgi:RES domain-containing protein